MVTDNTAGPADHLASPNRECGEAASSSVNRPVNLLGPSEIRTLAAELRLRPTKSLGQNFVHDPNTVRRIVRAADLDRTDVVLEVGPGLGSLTLALLPSAALVVAVEVDPVLAGALPVTVAERAPDLTYRLRIVHGDALRLTPNDLVDLPTALVANLPYNVAVPVVLHLLAAFPSIRRGMVMVQREVADRLTAAPGSKTYGVPTVKLAWHADARPAGRVPPSVFWPVPKVDSGLVSFVRRDPPARVRREAVFKVIDAAFAQRRKTLRSALASWAGGADRAAAVVVAAGLDPSVRGEALTVAQFAAIAESEAARPGASGHGYGSIS